MSHLSVWDHYNLWSSPSIIRVLDGHAIQMGGTKNIQGILVVMFLGNWPSRKTGKKTEEYVDDYFTEIV